MVACGSGLEMSSRWRTASGRRKVAEALGWTLIIVDVLRERFSSLDMCYHSSVGQILTTTSR